MNKIFVYFQDEVTDTSVDMDSFLEKCRVASAKAISEKSSRNLRVPDKNLTNSQKAADKRLLKNTNDNDFDEQRDSPVVILHQLPCEKISNDPLLLDDRSSRKKGAEIEHLDVPDDKSSGKTDNNNTKDIACDKDSFNAKKCTDGSKGQAVLKEASSVKTDSDQDIFVSHSSHENTEKNKGISDGLVRILLFLIFF